LSSLVPDKKRWLQGWTPVHPGFQPLFFLRSITIYLGVVA
jgi:hypothetical protein